MLAMNEFGAKKLAEVQAFVELSKQIAQKGSAALEKDAPSVLQNLQLIAPQMVPPPADSDLRSVFEAKVQKTVTKLRSMMDLYVGNSWDDAVEVLEWLSFYAGSALAHAALAAAVLDQSDHEKADQLTELSESFWQLLADTKQNLAEAGVRRISA